MANNKNNYKRNNTKTYKRKPNGNEFRNVDSVPSKSVKRGASSINDVIGEQNDPKWYTHNQRLITDVTKIPFNAQVGAPVPMNNGNWTVPSICVLSSMTVPGVAQHSSDGINLAGQALFAKMRKDLSTYAPYQQADVTEFVFAFADMMAIYAHLTRYFGLANLYSSVNLSYPKALLKSLGLSDPDEFIRNFNDYRSEFNNLVYKAQSLYMPAAFPIIERYLWMFSNVFFDHEDPRAQLYAYSPAGYWLVDEESASGTQLIYVGQNGMLISEWLDTFSTKIDQLRSSDSALKIMADLRNAFKDTQTWTLGFVSEDFKITPVYSTEVLSQIENTVVVPGVPSDPIIRQDVNNNYMTFRPYWDDVIIKNYIFSATSRGDLPGNRYFNLHLNFLLNMHVANPSQDDIVVATRNIPTYVYDATTSHLMLNSVGSDMVVRASIFTYPYGDPTNGVETVVPYICSLNAQLLAAANEPSFGMLDTKSMTNYLAFDWAPRILITDLNPIWEEENGTVFNSSNVNMYPVVEIDNYTSVEKSLLERIHRNVIMSMWNIPELGSTYN